MDLSKKRKKSTEGEEGVQQQQQQLVELPCKAAPTKMDSKNIKINVYLPEEIMEEILSRLPVKSLLRFRCVCKSWLSLITSERFIEILFQNSTKSSALSHHKFIFECMEGVFKQCSVHQLLNEASSIEASPIHDPTINEFLRGAYVKDCCNGLLFLLNYQRGGFCLWNPATMISMELPNLKGWKFAKFGFGWDGTSGAYKVFALSDYGGIREGNVFSSKTNSWKTVYRGCLPVYDSYGVFSCGKIHWLISGPDYIESFDLGSEEFGRIELPFNALDYTLAEIGGCLHLLCIHFDHNRQSYGVVWVMKEESGWLKLFTSPPVFDHELIPLCSLFGGGPNGEIFLIISDKFLFYNGKDVIVLPVSENIKYVNKGHVYVESLISPNFTTAS